MATSYQKVKQILDEAAGIAETNYQGYGNFWSTLPLEKFLKVEIYGIRMIAPIPTSSCDETLVEKGRDCCSSHKAEESTDSANEEEKKKEGLMLLLRPIIKYPGRGAKSGLIKGLRGEFPFDGDSIKGKKNIEGHFPRLPWGGKQVSDGHIHFISDWIDQGCPENEEVDDDASDNKDHNYHINLKLTNAYKAKLKLRKNIKNLSEEEVYRLRCATYELKKLNEWPRDRRSLYSWGKLHGNVCEHGWEQFLTWHRMFLYEFEQTLQDFDPTVTLPYWDWTDPEFNQGKIPKEFPTCTKDNNCEMGKVCANSSNCKKDKTCKNEDNYPKDISPISGIIPKAYRCWINLEAIDILGDKWDEKSEQDPGKWKNRGNIIAKLKTVKNLTFNSGVELFNTAKIENTKLDKDYDIFSPDIIDQLESINPLWYSFRYPGMFYQKINGKLARDKEGNLIPVGAKGLQQDFHHHYPKAEDIQHILQVDNWRDFGGGPEYNQSFGVLDMAPHNTIHIWLGGFNKNYKKPPTGKPENPLEPVIGDMLSNLTAGFDPIFWPHHVFIDRLFSIWQKNHPNQGPENQTGALAGLGYSVRDALSIERLGYEYASAGHVFQIENPDGVSVFKSDYIQFDALLYQYSEPGGKVELCFHKVIQPASSFVVRVFLNSPDADMFTPAIKEENKYYAGCIFFWGHGRCVGGPGHCAPPPAEKREGDIRPPNHNAKRNCSLDITDTVKKLADEGITELQVNLVVVGPDGSDCESEFFPEAVSVIQK